MLEVREDRFAGPPGGGGFAGRGAFGGGMGRGGFSGRGGFRGGFAGGYSGRGGYSGAGYGGPPAGGYSDVAAPGVGAAAAPNPFTDYASSGGDACELIYVRNVRLPFIPFFRDIADSSSCPGPPAMRI